MFELPEFLSFKKYIYKTNQTLNVCFSVWARVWYMSFYVCVFVSCKGAQRFTMNTKIGIPLNKF